MSKSGSIELTPNVQFEIYYNKYREKMRVVWDRTHPTYLFSGPFFSYETFNATCHMKVHGHVACKPPYGEYGFAWNDNENPQWCRLPCDKDNYFTNTVLVINGKRRSNNLLAWHKDADGTPAKPRYTSRPLYGLKDNSFMYNVVTSAISLPGAQDTVFKAGWEQALMSDGGGSTMYKDVYGNEIYSSRVIPYFILVYVTYEDPEPKGAKPMVTIRAYSKNKDGAKKLSSHFQVKEFACKDGSDAVFVAESLPGVLEYIRARGNAEYRKSRAKEIPMNIHSGYRTAAYNKSVKGAAESQHCYGTACDFSMPGIPISKLAKYAEEYLPEAGGIGIYDNAQSGHFVHVDVREQKARW